MSTHTIPSGGAGTGSTFKPFESASWIWRSATDPVCAEWVVFERDFQSRRAAPVSVFLSADSDYILSVNGRRVGAGPVRAWIDEIFYDVWRIDDFLQYGTNSIEVLVNYSPEGTVKRISVRAGLIAEVVERPEPVAAGSAGTGADSERHKASSAQPTILTASDGSWRAALHPGFVYPVPRISNGLGWSEVFDARKAIAGWAPAVVLASAHEFGRRLKPRPIAALSDRALKPVFPVSHSEVKSRGVVHSCLLRGEFFAGERDANKHKIFRAFLGIKIASSQARSVELLVAFDPHDSQPLPYFSRDSRGRTGPGKMLPLELNTGDNWLLFDISGIFHDPQFHFQLRNPPGLSAGPNALPDFEPEFHVAGPFGTKTEVVAGAPFDFSLPPDRDYEVLKTAFDSGEIETIARSMRVLPARHLSRHHAAIESYTQETIREIPVSAPLTALCAPYGLAPEHGVRAIGSPFQPDTGFPLRQAPGLVVENGEQSFVFDFQEELSGDIEFELAADPGVVVDFFGFESMHDGIIEHTYSLNNSLRYICKSGLNRYRSPVRRGFRFLMVTVRAAQGRARLHAIGAVASNFLPARIGQFDSSDERLNRIWKISRATLETCMEDTFVDCPAYEQATWTGDLYTSSLFSHYLYRAYDYVAFSHYLGGRTLDRSALVESMAASAWQNVIPNWSFLWAKSVCNAYMFSGDRGFLKQIFPALESLLNAALRRVRDNGPQRGLFVCEAWNLIDWAPLVTVKDGAYTHENALLVSALDQTARVARDIGSIKSAGRFETAAREIAARINTVLWNEAASCYIDGIDPSGGAVPGRSIHAQVFPLIAGIDPFAHRDALVHIVAHNPHGFVPMASPFAEFFRYEVLGAHGKREQLLDAVRAVWGNMLDHDAKSCWEGWSFIPGHHTRSHCHAWSSSPVYVTGRWVMGISPLEPGFATTLIDPCVDGFSWIRGQVPTPKGIIRFETTRGGGKNGTVEPLVRLLLPAEIEPRLGPGWVVHSQTVSGEQRQISLRKD